MAGNTIAKLAVLVTTDTGGLSAGMARSGNIVSNAADQMQGRFSSMAERLKNVKDVAGASTGSFRDMAGVLRAGPWALAAAGVAAVGVAAFRSARAADELELRAVKVADAWEAAHKQLTGKDVDIGFNKMDTWSGQWDRLKEAATQFFAVVAENSGILAFFKDITIGLAQAFEDLTEMMRTDEQRQRDATLKRLEKETAEKKKQFEIQQKMAKEAEDAAKKLADERNRAWEALERTAESITKSLRTPDEIFRDTVTELKNLQDSGLLSGETFARGLQRASDELKDATDRLQGVQRATDTRVAAAERFTMAGFSAAQGSKEQTKIEQNTKKSADHLAKHTDLLSVVAAGVVNLGKSGGVIKVSNL